MKIQDVTLGQAWQIFLDHCPIKIDLAATRNLVAVTIAAIAVLAQKAIAPPQLPPASDRPQLPPAPIPQSPPEPLQLGGWTPAGLLPAARNKPHHRRTAQLTQAITEAWGVGLRRYEDLIEYVRRLTGKGCSRRAIARFKDGLHQNLA